MKKIVFILGATLIQQLSFGQNSVGIGTMTPNPSAALDINTGNKGLLIPRVWLSSFADNNVISLPAHSLLVYNTNYTLAKGKGFYFNDGTQAAPAWVKINDMELPIYKGESHAGPMLQLDNYNQSAAAVAIKGYSATGTGIVASSTSGYALEANGKIKITGASQVPAQGKVLTSDGNGSATWQGGVAFSAVGILVANANLAPGVETKVAFATVQYDLGGDYNNSNTNPHSTFKAPEHGIYHFDVQADFFATVDKPSIKLKIKRNGVEWTAGQRAIGFDGIQVKSLSINQDIELLPGDEVFVTARQGSSSNNNLLTGAHESWFSGRLVIKL